jgi:hypothetical protein
MTIDFWLPLEPNRRPALKEWVDGIGQWVVQTGVDVCFYYEHMNSRECTLNGVWEIIQVIAKLIGAEVEVVPKSFVSPCGEDKTYSRFHITLESGEEFSFYIIFREECFCFSCTDVGTCLGFCNNETVSTVMLDILCSCSYNYNVPFVMYLEECCEFAKFDPSENRFFMATGNGPPQVSLLRE